MFVIVVTAKVIQTITATAAFFVELKLQNLYYIASF